jgi:hypothetical protein
MPHGVVPDKHQGWGLFPFLPSRPA